MPDPDPLAPDPSAAPAAVEAFIERWQASGGHERANYQLFLAELCDLLDVPRPDPAKPENAENAYVFERSVARANPDGTSSTRYLDLYRSGCFVLETKQGATAKPAKTAGANADPTLLPPAPDPVVSTGHGRRGTAGYDKAMEKAFNQATGYIRDLPASEGRPPFLVVCDVGHVFELYAEFTRSGGRYQRFPDPKNHRVHLDDLRDPETRALLRAIWTDPLSLDPSRRVARVTRDIAGRLAALARSLEEDGHDPEVAALFLQRCLFTMFAEDIGLLPENGFLDLLRKIEKTPAGFPVLVTGLWKDMATGTDFSAVLMKKVARFNGGLFENPAALPLSGEQIALLVHAAESDWTEVDPAIFGTLLERALDPRERHKLGAHYTPRSYVERLIEPTVMEPLRAEWEAVKTAAVQHLDRGREKKARAEVETWHHRLCRVRVLDPACGSGNFLYVTLEHLKRLEAEVLDFFESIGGDRTLEMDSFKLRPTQFLGIELNPSAARIAQLVLWIGYFQWHHRTTGTADTNDRPLLKGEGTIENRDAVLDYDERVPRRDGDGQVVTVWDGQTTKPHPVTGKEVPDERARKVLFDFVNPRRPEWPEADFVVGNPPFVGGWKMREAFGEGYIQALWSVYDLPEKADFVMYWWEKAAELLSEGKINRFGLITTNSVTQVFQSRIIKKWLDSVALVFAVPDHPWVDSGDGAAVRIAMTVGQGGKHDGQLLTIVGEEKTDDIHRQISFREQIGMIASNLRLGADLTSVVGLEANDGIVSPGVQLYGSGFTLNADEKDGLAGGVSNEVAGKILRPYINAKEFVQRPGDRWVIDFFDMTEDEAREAFPGAYQHLLTHVKPERDANKRASIREVWWRFGWERPKLRNAVRDLDRFIVTPEVSKHRIFGFLDSETLPDNMLTVIASREAFTLGVLSSRLHTLWALSSGASLEDRPRYTKSRCFDPFPFPDPDESTRERIRDLGERLDAHRKRQQAAHPDLTLTRIYNVLERLRSGEPLTDKERRIHDDGLVSVLRQIHDDLDAAVFHAYGWDDLRQRLAVAPARSPHRDNAGDNVREEVEAELLERLVALNHERAEEEKRGLARWLRPEFQAPDAGGVPEAKQQEIELQAGQAAAKPLVKPGKQPWPDALPEQVAAIQKLLPALGPDPEALAAAFGRKSAKRTTQIADILATLEALGRL
ncbi:MAG: DNA methyltransferase [Verrucomicrobiales bacterium]